MTVLLSERALAWKLGIPRDRLRQIAANVSDEYRQWDQTDKRTGKVRTLTGPSDELKEIQRRLNRHVFSATPIPAAAHGGVRGKSSFSNAAMHVGKRCVINIDVKKFFPSVRHYIVYRFLRAEMGFGRDVARIITKLVTVNGQLPQGAPTSTVIANLLLASAVDKPVTDAAQELEIEYTRYVDDATFSGDDPRPIINFLARRLSGKRLAIHRRKSASKPTDKFRITPRSRPQEVTGFLVNGSRPTLSKKRRDAVRAAIHELSRMGTEQERDVAVRSIRGRIAHVKRFHPGTANRLQKYLDSTLEA